ncbi:hypothetical protein [Pseudomonas syringae group genomosp. 7]|uniref:hypothetical protein n=1 Tax=Pseudomonas syringae group genomosp. 7 TaxID=251699 RepID=UPI00376F95A1
MAVVLCLWWGGCFCWGCWCFWVFFLIFCGLLLAVRVGCVLICGVRLFVRFF